jgi:hypothetical protein
VYAHRVSADLSPQAFMEHWYGETLRSLNEARTGDASARAQLPFIEDRVRFYEWLTAERLVTEAELVGALERTVRGDGPTVGIRICGAIKG